MPDQPVYKVMISSTTRDLPEHRKAAVETILRAVMFPLAMEYSSAQTDTNALKFSLQMVDDADIYVGIFGFRYGFRPVDSEHNPKNLSVTELEYRRALERKIPVLVFVMNDDHPRVMSDIDQGDNQIQMQRLRAELGSNHILSYFSSAEQLKGLMLQSLLELRPTLDSAKKKP